MRTSTRSWTDFHRLRAGTRRALRILFVVAAAQGAGACSATKSLFQPKLALKEVRFEVSRKANDNAPFPVELVAVSDEALLTRLLAMGAAEWFAPDTNIKRDYPASALRTWYYELTPGSTIPVRNAEFGKRGLRAILLFANYHGQGAYRLRLDAMPLARVQFKEKTIDLADQP